MKNLFLITLLFITANTSAFAQTKIQIDTAKKTMTTSTRMSMTGADLKKIYDAMKFAPGIYDQYYKRIDSAEAIKTTKTYQNGIELHTLGEGLTYRVLVPLNSPAQVARDIEVRKYAMPKNPALQEGAILDIRPFGGNIPPGDVKDKAIVLVFWYPGAFGGNGIRNSFTENNEVIDQFYDQGKFKVYAVTRYPLEQSMNALKKAPIAHAQHLFASPDIYDIYSPTGKTLLIVTDKDHKITYSALNNVGITPRVLYGLLKGL